MATFEALILANGQLPAAKGTLYTVPGGKKAYVKYVGAFNPSGGTETIRFYIKKAAGTSRQIARGVLLTNETLRAIEQGETLNLGAGDIIEGDTTTATTVDYLISGVEETP